MAAYFRFILRHRWLVLGLMALLTAASGLVMTRGIFASSMGRMFLGEHPRYQRYIERAAVFGNNEAALVAFEDPDPFSPKSRRRLRKATTAVLAIPSVRSVRSVLDVQEIVASGEDLVVRTYAETADFLPGGAEGALERLRADRFAKGLLVSEDGRYNAVIVELEAEADMPAEDAPRLISEILDAFEGAGYERSGLHVVGSPANIGAIISQTRFNIKRLFPIVALVLVLAVWVMFRRLWPVAVTMTVSLVAVIWTMGFAVLLDRHISVLISMIPAVILIISFSDVIHLCSAYLLELGQGLPKDEAILVSGSEVGAACMLTSVTTLIGFVSLSLIPTPVFRQLGLVLGFGVAMALLIAVTLVPIFFSLIRQPKPWRTGTTGRVQDLLDSFLSWASGLSNRRPWTVVFFFVLVLAVSVIGLMRLKIETDFAKRLPEDHAVRVDGRYYNDRFAGANVLDVFLETNEPGGLLDPKLLSRIAAFQDAVQQMPEVSQATSLVDMIKTLHAAFSSGEPDADPLPSSREALAQYLLLFEMSGGEDLERLVDFQRRTMRMSVQMKDEGVRHTWNTGVKIQEQAREILGDQVEAEVTGLICLMGEWLDKIISGQRRGLLFAVLSITVIMSLGLRSLRVGLWSMIPNITPLLVLGGVLGLCWDQVDSDNLALAMIAVGIGVDDTIHFLMRLRIESGRHRDVQAAVDRTFHFSGRGIVITSVILVLGFFPFALSEYLTLHIMGTLLPMTLIVALAADLFLVPALVRLGFIRY